MAQETVRDALIALDSAELSRFARVAARVLGSTAMRGEGDLSHRGRVGHGSDFIEFRAYTPEDDAHRIDWRASARSRRPLVRRFHDETAGEWWICVDRSASMAIAGGGKWRLAAVLAAVLSHVLLDGVNRVGLMTFSAAVEDLCPLGRGRVHREKAFSFLSEARARRQGGGSRLGECASRVGRNASVIVISDFLAPDFMRDELERLLARGRRLRALRIASPNDVDPGAARGMLLEDIETGATMRAGGDRSALATVAAGRLDRLDAALARYCRNAGIALTRCETGEDWRAILTRHLIGEGRDRA